MKRREIKILPTSILGMCFVLTGCGLSAPTYGTDKAVSLQFFEDVANLASLTSTNNNSQLVMENHPKLVIPKSSSRTVLPLPQQDVAQDGSLGRTGRLKQHSSGSKASVSPQKVSSVNEHASNAGSESISRLSAKQRQEYLRRQRAQVGSAKYRRYLTEPPLSYRQPAKTAPVGK
ncbi:hypothetical protein [Bartonella taylorii]|uniref:Lipoprotein n=1 Tax=Bartonella taylorii TaxID=33046 RepID=A0A9Q9DM12_BARTA|nr:hypothetical protein [Bartonella taylorii]OPB35335.1 hypothetical protein Btaycd_005830 [Bartonella taylorii]USP02694.1 hypothetical protein LAJ60_07470 [Bartonella taylorii]